MSTQHATPSSGPAATLRSELSVELRRLALWAEARAVRDCEGLNPVTAHRYLQMRGARIQTLLQQIFMSEQPVSPSTTP